MCSNVHICIDYKNYTNDSSQFVLYSVVHSWRTESNHTANRFSFFSVVFMYNAFSHIRILVSEKRDS